MEKPNIIFIVVDTLRKDYSGILEESLKKYGFISYSRVIAPSSWTIPSHASMFTGLYPALHGAHETKTRKPPYVKLKKSEIVLTYWLKHNLGYKNFLLSANPQVTPRMGFSGFDHVKEVEKPVVSILSEKEKEYLAYLRWNKSVKNSIDSFKVLLSDKKYALLFKFGMDYLISNISNVLVYIFKRWPKEKGSSIIKRELKKIVKKEKIKNGGNFIFINLIEVHEPYLVFEKLSFVDNFRPNGPNTKFVKKWQKKYLEESKYVTKKVISIIETLKKHGMFENSLLIVTSDHGQLLGEGKRIGHGTFLDDELLMVPLLIRYPDKYPIKRIYVQDSWISLASLYNLITDVSQNKLDSDNLLYSETVFAESYGVVRRISSKSGKISNDKLNKFERYRIAIYYRNFKGIFDVEQWRFEKVLSYDSKIEVTDEVMRRLKKEVLKFLKTSTKFKTLKI